MSKYVVSTMTDDGKTRHHTTNNVWSPGVSGWREITPDPGDGTPAGAPAWVQPTGAHDAYALGDQVTYDGKTWKSTIGVNVWAPGVFGWEPIQ